MSCDLILDIWRFVVDSGIIIVVYCYSRLGQERELEGESSMELKESDHTMKEDEKKGERKREEEGGESSSVQWWLAPPHARAKKLLLRQATTGDQKKQGAARQSQYYMKYGNPNEPLKKEPLDLRLVIYTVESCLHCCSEPCLVC